MDHPIAKELLKYQILEFDISSNEKESLLAELKKVDQFEKLRIVKEQFFFTSDYLPSDYGRINGAENPNPWYLNHLAYFRSIKATKAWALTRGSPEVKIAIVDAYFKEFSTDPWHPDLINEIEREDILRSFASYPANNFCVRCMHGTAVSLLASGSTDNGVIGTASIGFNTKLMIYDGTGSKGWNHILQAARDGADVINCSWADCEPSDDERMIVEFVTSYYDALIVAAAGNDQWCEVDDAYRFPASFDDVVSVAGLVSVYNSSTEVEQNKIRPEFTLNDKVSLSAPSSFGTLPFRYPRAGYNPNSAQYWNSTKGSSISVNGSSFASPLVAGTAALMRSVNPTISAKTMKRILIETANPDIYDQPAQNGDPGIDYLGRAGSGRLDSYAAVKAAMYTGYDFLWSWFFFDNENNLEQAKNGIDDDID